MGSTGTGRFTDYSGSKGSNQQGGSSGENLCDQAFSAGLEEIERSDYYRDHKELPSVDTQLTVVLRGRLTVVTEKGEILGYLPTSYNYLAGCIKMGQTYVAVVTLTSSDPVLKIQVDVAPA